MTEALITGALIAITGIVSGVVLTIKIAQVGSKFLIEQSKRAQKGS